jgi:tetratricopeptide (TPR) repeat protein
VELLQYIDDYFAGRLSGHDRSVFENRCETDPDFAREVALYISMRGAIRESLHDQKRKDLESFHEQSALTRKPKSKALTIFLYAASIAASVVLVMFLFFNSPEPHELAQSYIDKNLETLSVTMGSEQDSMAVGINAYNDHDYQRAEIIFRNLVRHKSLEFNAVKYLGLVYLKTESYDKALAHFDRLAANESAFGNPAEFYKALTLMKRSEGTDLTEAKKILHQIVADRKAGYKEAERWLEEMK